MGNKQSNANEPQDGVPVNLHVYKPTDPNNVGLPGFRIYHTGIEIYGCEYTFAGNQTQSTGVTTQRPKANPMGGQWSFLQTEVLGHTQMSKQEIKELIFEMKRDFIANTYDLTSRNCNHFTEAVAKNIGMRSYPGKHVMCMYVYTSRMSVLMLSVHVDICVH